MPSGLSIYVAQLCSSLIVAGVLLGYHRWYRQAYLRDWALSFLALAGYFIAILASMQLVAAGLPRNQWPLLPLPLLYLWFGYLQILLLLSGTLRLVHDDPRWMPGLRGIALLALGLALLMFLPLAWEPETSALRNTLRIGMRYLLGGVAFLVAAAVLAMHLQRGNVGWRLVLASFVAYGLEMATLGGLNVLTLGGEAPALLLTLVRLHGLVELVIYPTIGLGMVIWLLSIERQRASAALASLRDFNRRDALTGLLNTTGLSDSITAWRNQGPPDARLSLVLIGIDRFKLVNESHGLKFGDDVLVAVGHRLQRLRWNDRQLARVVGDEFLLALPGVAISPAQLEALRQLLQEPYRIRGTTLMLEFSLGWQVMAARDWSAERCLAELEAARQQARKLPTRCCEYQTGLHAVSTNWVELDGQIRRGLQSAEFTLFLQPIHALPGRQIVGFEALARWQHPERGLLSPVHFLPYLERFNLTHAFDQWLFEAAALAANQLARCSLPLPVSINLSADSLADARTLPALLAACARHRLPPQRLVVELTENMAMQDAEAGRGALSALVEAGFALAIDDFGSGYSSLTYLTRLPTRRIKFDRSFTVGLAPDSDALQVMAAMVDLCHRIGKRVVAEGVETPAQITLLQSIGCDEAQGYLLGRPAPLADILRQVERESA